MQRASLAGTNLTCVAADCDSAALGLSDRREQHSDSLSVLTNRQRWPGASPPFGRDLLLPSTPPGFGRERGGWPSCHRKGALHRLVRRSGWLRERTSLHPAPAPPSA